MTASRQIKVHQTLRLQNRGRPHMTAPPSSIVFIDFFHLKLLLVHSLEHSCFWTVRFFFNEVQVRSCDAFLVLRIGADRFVAAPGVFCAQGSPGRLVISWGQGPGHVVRRLRKVRQRRPSEVDPAEASPVAAGPYWRACFEKSSDMRAGRLLTAGRANQTVGKRA